MLKLIDIVRRDPTPQPWGEVHKIPWDDPEFSRRMLAEHLSQAHDAASRRAETIDRQVDWIDAELLERRPARILDLGCGPGLYLSRLAGLGHQSAGIDFGPASIEHACGEAERLGLRIDYTLGDLRATGFPGGQDLIMLIFGELNVFIRDEALDILTRARQALRPGGRMLLEVHTFDAVRQMGQALPTWRAAERGLFSDRPHIRLDDAYWDTSACAAVIRHYIIDAEAAGATLYGSSVQAYEREEYESLLETAGFEYLEWREDWPGLSDDFLVLVGAAGS